MKNKFSKYYEDDRIDEDRDDDPYFDFKQEEAYFSQYPCIYKDTKNGNMPVSVLQKYDAQDMVVRNPDRIFELPKKYIDSEFIAAMIYEYGDEYIPVLSQISRMDVTPCIFQVLVRDPITITKFKYPNQILVEFALNSWRGSLSPLADLKFQINDALNGNPSLCASIIAGDPSNISYLSFPSEATQLQAVALDGNAILHILAHSNVSDNVKRIAVSTTPSCIQYIPSPSDDLAILAVGKEPDTIKHVSNPSYKVQLVAVTKSPASIAHIKNPIDKIQMISVKKDISIARHIENPCRAVQLKILKRATQSSRLYLKNIDEDLLLGLIEDETIHVWDWNHFSKMKNFTDEMRVFLKMRFGDSIKF